MNAAVFPPGVIGFDLCVVLGIAERATGLQRPVYGSEEGLADSVLRVRRVIVDAGLLPAEMPRKPPE